MACYLVKLALLSRSRAGGGHVTKGVNMDISTLDGFDYEHQAWYKGGKYIRCGHTDDMACQCFGKVHEGMRISQNELALRLTKVGR
jgi:hypothetical protein